MHVITPALCSYVLSTRFHRPSVMDITESAPEYAHRVFVIRVVQRASHLLVSSPDFSSFACSGSVRRSCLRPWYVCSIPDSDEDAHLVSLSDYF
jgi:hypothetical protein